MADTASSDPVGDLEGWAAQLQQKASRYGQLQQALNELSVERTSQDGRVRMAVDSNGVPTDITLTERARGAAPAELTKVINSTLQAAQAELRSRVENLTSEIVGDDAPANNIVAQYRDRFPDVEPSADAGPEEMQIGAFEEHHGDEPSTEPSPSEPSHAPGRQATSDEAEPGRSPRRRSNEDDPDGDDWSGRSIFE